MDVIKGLFGKAREVAEVVVAPKKDDGYSRDVSTCPGYTVNKVKETEHGMTAELKLAGSAVDAFGKDIHDLVLEVEYQTEYRLHVHIRDAGNKQYQITEEQLPRPLGQQPNSRQLEFHYQKDPFAFKVTRPDGEVLFDTLASNIPKHSDPIKKDGKSVPRSDSEHHPLVFSDQYLQLASVLPDNANIYGLGETIDSKGLRRNNEGSISTMWSRDAGTPADENIYGTHPFYLETRAGKNGGPSQSHGVFLRNSHGMDVLLRKGLIEYRVLGGTLDFYFMFGPSPKAVVQQYSEVIGKPAQMPFWAFGFHMCRWEGEFSTLERLQKVVDRMRKEDLPLETVWSDLDYMHKKRNFTAGENFPEAKYRAFVDWLHENKQHYVPLIDAAIGMPDKKDPKDTYDVYTNGHKQDVFLKHPSGEEFIGAVWPGPTVFPDWSAPKVTQWWKDSFDEYRKIAKYDGVWLDMNEPANFNTTDDKNLSGVKYEANLINEPPYEIHNGEGKLGWRTMWPDVKRADGALHYNVHNMYGYEENLVTHKVLIEQNPNRRPFMLSRSNFAGLGRVSAHWLGDNYSTWESMRHSLQGVLSFQMYQIPMVGPDSCGFSGDVSEELANRWMQLGAFYPFYRNHNADSAKPQEPYTWKSVAEATRNVMKTRYQLLPYWETLFAEAKLKGTPPVRPLFFEFDDAQLFGVEEQFLVGPSLLITPVLHEGKAAVTGFFPSADGTTWRDWTTGEVVKPDSKGQAELLTPLGHINVHIRSGSIIMIHDKPAYSLTKTRESPYGLSIHLDSKGKAKGEAVLDDGLSVDGPATYVTFSVSNNKLTVYADGEYKAVQGITKITVYGVKEEPMHVEGAEQENVSWKEGTNALVVEGLQLALSGETTVSWE